MYVEIGNYRVHEEELLPTQHLRDDYVFEWETIPSEMYSILMVDLDAPYPETPSNSPYLHFLMMNIVDKPGYDGIHAHEGDILFEYIAPSPPPDSEPHRYEIYVFKQLCLISDVLVEDRIHFDLENWIIGTSTFTRDAADQPLPCGLELVEKVTFYGGVTESDFVALETEDQESFSPTVVKRKEDQVFSKYYDLDTLSDEDLLILGEMYGLSDPSSLSSSEIQSKIGHILAYND